MGLYAWAHNLLPVVGSKSCNPLSRDIILQLVERYREFRNLQLFSSYKFLSLYDILYSHCRILSTPKACTILVNGAVRKGERLVPPFALEILLRLTFPASSARVKVCISNGCLQSGFLFN